MQAFGGPVRLFTGDAADLKSSASAPEDVNRSYAALTALTESGAGSLRIFRPHPTAAFAPRDTTLPPYAETAAAMNALGFTPVERRAGGALAIYDPSALVIDLVAPHDDPRHDVMERFRHFSAAIAGALRRFAIDARVGQVEGEYCPGDYSVNAGGTVKLAGLAQRIGRRGYHMGAVISVESSIAAKQAVAEAYRIMGFDFAPESFGAARELSPRVTFSALSAELLETIGMLVKVET